MLGSASRLFRVDTAVRDGEWHELNLKDVCPPDSGKLRWMTAARTSNAARVQTDFMQLSPRLGSSFFTHLWIVQSSEVLKISDSGSVNIEPWLEIRNEVLLYK